MAERLYLWMRTPDAGLSIEITGLEPDDDAPILELRQRQAGTLENIDDLRRKENSLDNDRLSLIEQPVHQALYSDFPGAQSIQE